MKAQKLFRILLVILALFLALLSYKSIMRPEKFKSIYDIRKTEIVKRLETLRAVEAIYKSEHKDYTANIDSLIDFVNNGKITIVQTSGNIPEGMTEDQAFKAGLITKQEIQISAKEKILESDQKVQEESLKNFYLIPESGGKRFNIETSTLSNKSSLYTIGVYRVEVPIDDILINMSKTISPDESGFFLKFYNRVIFNNLENEKQYRNQYDPIILGSLTEASTSGNWEKSL